ncbi:MAG TPA: shikimate dehydrogenase [Vicinamibacteria bacterium]
MTQICVSLTEETTAGLLARMEALTGIADMFEVRGDLVLDLDLLALLRARRRPLLFTCRPESEGGRWRGDEERRRLILLEAVRRGFDYVDVEYRSGFLDVMVEKSGHGLVVSYHDLSGTPKDLDGLYTSMSDRGADVVKIGVTPKSIADVGRLLDFAGRVSKGGGPPVLPIALGVLGQITRIVAGRYRAPFTFASTAEGAESAPGQLPAERMADLYRVRDISPSTHVYAVVGSDVSRSLSPVIHNRAFEARQLDAVYVPVQAEALPPFIRALPGLALSGFSVTRPYKTEIVPFMDELTDEARAAGSVNTVVVTQGVLQGSTSDGTGILAPLKKRVSLVGREVVIIGAGGAARAAALALHKNGAHVRVVARRPEKAVEVAQAVGCAHGSLEHLRDYPWDVLINATPLGSHSALEQTAVPASGHRPGTVVVDMVYDPLETRFLREAQAAGCTIIDGLGMLIAQAGVQFELWTGMEAPLDVMKSAAIFLAQEGE